MYVEVNGGAYPKLYARVTAGGNIFHLDGDEQQHNGSEIFQVIGQDDKTSMVILKTVNTVGDFYYVASHFGLIYYEMIGGE
jgi:hypothetical protein